MPVTSSGAYTASLPFALAEPTAERIDEIKAEARKRGPNGRLYAVRSYAKR